MKKKNHLKKLALLGITSGIMIASQGQAAETDNLLAANNNTIRRGNYVSGSGYSKPCNSGQCKRNNELAENYKAPSSGKSGWSTGSSCGGKSGCGGAQPPVSSSCGGVSSACGGQPPISNCHSVQSCGGQPPVHSCGGMQKCSGQPIPQQSYSQPSFPQQACGGQPMRSCGGAHSCGGQGQMPAQQPVMPPPPVNTQQVYNSPPQQMGNWNYNQN